MADPIAWILLEDINRMSDELVIEKYRHKADGDMRDWYRLNYLYKTSPLLKSWRLLAKFDSITAIENGLDELEEIRKIEEELQIENLKEVSDEWFMAL